MKIKTQDLIGPALDWAVAKCEGIEVLWSAPHEQLLRVGLPYSPFVAHRDWTIGGPIIERENISLDNRENEPCRAFKGVPAAFEFAMWAPEGCPLLAGMRCHVASKLGDEVDVPEELLR